VNGALKAVPYCKKSSEDQIEPWSNHSIVLCGFTLTDTSTKLCFGSMNISLLRMGFFLFLKHYIIKCFYKTTMTYSCDQVSSIKASKILIIEKNVVKITGRDLEKKDKIDQIY